MSDTTQKLSQLWRVNIEATVEADNPEDAEAIVQRLTERVLEHPAVWNTLTEFDPDQRTETVDASV